MKTIKLLLCVLLTAMSLKVFANENDRYETVAPASGYGVFITDKRTGKTMKCYHEISKDEIYCYDIVRMNPPK